MRVKSLGKPRAPQVDWDIFEGVVRADEVVTGDDSSVLRVYDVTFEPGARTVWHTHTVDQVLVITAGHWTVATEIEERDVRAGDLVVFPAGELHWHGATATTEMSHLALMSAGKDQY